MQVSVDEFGNRRVVVEPGDSEPDESVTPAPRSKVKKKESDFDIAQQAIDLWGRPLAYQADKFWSYDPEDGWQVCTDELMNLCNELRGSYTEKTVMKIIASKFRLPDLELVTEQATYWELVENSWEPFPVKPTEVVFSNGILDIDTMEFTPTAERIIFGPRISIPFDPKTTFKAGCREFEALVEYALPDKDTRNYLQEICGLILQPHVVFRGQIVFYGITHTGKSTLATAIATAPAGVLGQTAVTEARIVSDKWAPTMLLNRFACVSHDSKITDKWESWMKGYTSGSFTIEPKFGRPVTAPATAKIITTCNEFQKLMDASGAAELRYRIFKFQNQIAESTSHSQSKYMTSSYWGDMTRRKGVLGWMLRGLFRVIKNGLVESDELKKIKREIISEAHPILDFVSTEIQEKEGEFLETGAIMDALNIDPKGREAQQLPKFIYRIWKTKKVRYKGKRGYKNLKLRD